MNKRKKKQQKKKDPIKEKENIELQIEKLTNVRQWITPKIEWNKEWEHKLMIFGDKESRNIIKKYVTAN